MAEKTTRYAWLLLLIFIILPRLTFADDHNVTVAWDTVVAEMQIIEQSTIEDSLKSKLMIALFARCNLTEEDYRSFYERFMSLPLQQQREFLERVKTIVPRLTKLEELAPPTENSRLKIPGKKKE